MTYRDMTANTKGGVGKTKRALLLAFYASQKKFNGHADQNVMFIDADAYTQTATDYATAVYAKGGELPFNFFQWTPSEGLLVPFIQKKEREEQPDLTVIDIGRTDANEIRRVAQICNRVTIPTGSTTDDYPKVYSTYTLVQEAQEVHVMFSKVTSTANSLKKIRSTFETSGLTVLRTEVELAPERYNLKNEMPTKLYTFVDAFKEQEELAKLYQQELAETQDDAE
jgi:hypothetical protein